MVARLSRQNLHTTYSQAMARIRVAAQPTPEEERALDQLFRSAETRERHLRKQMRTTYTPVQQRLARQLWQERQGRRLTEEQRRALRAQLRVTPTQEVQFQAYEDKLRGHRQSTLQEAFAMLNPEKRPLLVSVVSDFEQL